MTITAVPGVLAAHATDEEGATGVTAFLFPAGARAAVFVPGSATGSRELGVLEPGALADRIHGICLAGGSAYGLAAADGVLQVLAAQGVGFPTPFGVVPIVPAAILFDLHTATRRPDAALGAAAARAASSEALPSGRVGAGRGARVGALAGSPAPGGFGTASARVGAFTVGVAVAVNAGGSVYDPDAGRFVAGVAPQALAPSALGQNTTLAVIATDAPLDRDRATVLAKMAAAGMARTLFPAFTPFDGDLIFAVSTGQGAPVDPNTLAALGDAAATLLARAIVGAVT